MAETTISSSTNQPIAGTQAASHAAVLAENTKEKERKTTGIAATTGQPANGMQIFAFLIALFLGLKDKEIEEGEEADPDVADDSTLHTIADALGLDFEKFQGTVANVKSGKTSVYAAAASTFWSVDTDKADFAKAEAAYKSYNNLEDLPPADNANFLKAVDVVLKLEGGWNPNEPDGGVANFGINNRANPDVDVRNLTQSAAVQLYKTRYWDKIEGIDQLDQRTALVAFDLAVNSGVGRANKMLKESGGDVAKLMELREKFYENLIAKNPAKYAQYESGWKARMDHLEIAVTSIPAAAPALVATAEPQKKVGLTATHAQTMEIGGKAEDTPVAVAAAEKPTLTAEFAAGGKPENTPPASFNSAFTFAHSGLAAADKPTTTAEPITEPIFNIPALLRPPSSGAAV